MRGGHIVRPASMMNHQPGTECPVWDEGKPGETQGETPAGMAAGVSIGDEGQGREGEILDTS